MKADIAGKDIDAAWSFARYEQIRHRLPRADFPQRSEYAGNLGELADRFDVFLLDAFGVLNIGETAIPGAPERISQLRRAGKTLFVLTNSATHPSRKGPEKYQQLGYAFSRREIISSRDLLINALKAYPAGMKWGVAAPLISRMQELAPNVMSLAENPNAFDHMDGFIFLSAQNWPEELQAALILALKTRPRPLLVGNFDLVAPREQGFSLQPGHFSNEIADESGIAPVFYGKPFGNAFDETMRRLSDDGIHCPPERMAMVGDTLHTDILGGAAVGLKTILVTDHGLFKGQEITPYIEKSKIIPDFIIPSI